MVHPMPIYHPDDRFHAEEVQMLLCPNSNEMNGNFISLFQSISAGSIPPNGVAFHRHQ